MALPYSLGVVSYIFVRYAKKSRPKRAAVGRRKKQGREIFPSLLAYRGIAYLMLPRSFTLTLEVWGIAEMSSDTVIFPSNISFTRAL